MINNILDVNLFYFYFFNSVKMMNYIRFLVDAPESDTESEFLHWSGRIDYEKFYWSKESAVKNPFQTTAQRTALDLHPRNQNGSRKRDVGINPVTNRSRDNAKKRKAFQSVGESSHNKHVHLNCVELCKCGGKSFYCSRNRSLALMREVLGSGKFSRLYLLY